MLIKWWYLTICRRNMIIWHYNMMSNATHHPFDIIFTRALVILPPAPGFIRTSHSSTKKNECFGVETVGLATDESSNGLQDVSSQAWVSDDSWYAFLGLEISFFSSLVLHIWDDGLGGINASREEFIRWIVSGVWVKIWTVSATLLLQLRSEFGPSWWLFRLDSFC